MYLIPLHQVESVELVIHALKAAAGEADCSTCPAHRVCMKQCLSVAAGVERLLDEQALPTLTDRSDSEPPRTSSQPDAGARHLKIIK